MPKCTYCGGTQFFEGPSGGMSTNILCMNDACRHWFNWTPAIDELDDLKRVEPTKEEHDLAEAARRAANDARHEAFFEEGRQAYRDRKPLHTLRQNYSYTSESRATISKLCGYIEAMGGEVRGVCQRADEMLSRVDKLIPSGKERSEA